MSYQVFARKTRPRQFSEVVGQSHVLQALANGLDANRVHHAFLFTGTRGVGKTTIARIFSKALNCEKGVSATPCGECAHCVDIDQGRFVDLIEIDAASRTGVDDIRELIENVQYAPSRGRYKVYLIDEVHMLSNSAFNALLKTLEEPPEHVKFLLATTDPQKIPVTVLSRCLQFSLRRLSSAEIKTHLGNVLDADAVEYEPAALNLIARAADGSVRDSLSLLDQALNFGAGRLAESETRTMLGTVDESRVIELLHALLAGDATKVFEQVDTLQTYGFDWRASLQELATLCQRIAVYQQAPSALPDDTPALEAIQNLSTNIAAADVQLFYQVAVAGLRDLDFAPEPRAGFEMAVLRMLAFRPASAVVQPPARPAAGRTTAKQAPSSTPAEAQASATKEVKDQATPAKSEPTAAQQQPQTGTQAAAASQAPAGAAKQAEALPVAEEPLAPAYAEPAAVSNEPVAGSEQAQSTEDSHVQQAAGQVDWMVLVASLPLKAMALELANNTSIVSQSADHLLLGISQETAMVCPEGIRQRMLELVQQRLPNVKIELSIVEADSLVANETPAAKAAQVDADRNQSAQDSIARDPNVQQLVSGFDGHVEPESIQPRELSE